MKNKNLIIVIFISFCCSCKPVKSSTITSEIELKSVLENVDSLLIRNAYKATNNLELPYRLFTPSIHQNKKIPLVIFLHGRGERGTENGARIYRNAGIIMNENSLITPQSQANYPCYILVPQCSNKTENKNGQNGLEIHQKHHLKVWVKMVPIL
ncbi:hypothetical protein [Polaribacter sp. SA4-12]|uniref:hypothetical protein n=1 Tax=Polaribacter sp. SA4-12 TaxID=1312072 RepID=UPI000B3CE331|nr:hypothetical protein [Polaribacter sp. SA4-12]ARV14675.1 hypothetical protein BTO07_05700 [Polaribacter sp. SA4-12]